MKFVNGKYLIKLVSKNLITKWMDNKDMRESNKIKVLFLVVYSEGMEIKDEEYGVCSIVSFLRKNGYTVMLLGDYEEQIGYRKIDEFKPDIIGLPVYLMSKDAVYRVCSLLKKLYNVPICVGGYFPTYYEKEMMEETSSIDISIRGEGELTWLRILKKIEQNESLKDVSGITYRTENGIMVNKEQEELVDINELPFIARDLLRDNEMIVATIASSRGCTRKCSFCCADSFWPKWRGKSAEAFVDEIEYIVNEYNVDLFNIIDTSFEDPGSNYKRVMSIAQEIVNRDLKIGYHIDLRTTFHKKIDKELISILKKSGLIGVMFGIEAANEADLKIYNKAATVEDNEKAVELFKENGFHVTPGFINFNPYSTFDGLRKNIEFLEKYGFNSAFCRLRSSVRLNRGTKLFEKIEADRLLKDGAYDDPYRYNFVDSRISVLIEFIRNFYDEHNVKNNYSFGRIDAYTNEHLMFIEYYKHRFSSECDNGAFKVIQMHEQQIREILSEINTRNSKWFKLLLNQAEELWSEEAAISIMNTFFDTKHMVSMANLLDKIKIKLYYDLSKIDSKYERYFKVHKTRRVIDKLL
ncbi:B12-binding domain-containing radical SAM protein [Ruminiclostridium cellobioparum]|nr:radical SAM protein [Ruminiclostridium cellobioparum]